MVDCDCTIETITQSHARKFCSTKHCSCRNKQNDTKPCKANWCEPFYEHVKRYHKQRDPRFENAILSRWKKEPWELAQCYLSQNLIYKYKVSRGNRCSGFVEYLFKQRLFLMQTEHCLKRYGQWVIIICHLKYKTTIASTVTFICVTDILFFFSKLEAIPSKHYLPIIYIILKTATCERTIKCWIKTFSRRLDANVSFEHFNVLKI